LPAGSVSDSCQALAINEPGDIVGVCEMGSGARAVLWKKGGRVDALQTLPGHAESEALGINLGGDIVGSSGDPEVQRRAVIWERGSIRDLGTLAGGTSSRALGINARGEVVGTSQSKEGNRAFIWTKKDGMQDLNGLLTARLGLVSAPFVLTQAMAINTSGVILAIGEDAPTQDHAAGHAPGGHKEPAIRVFLLTPGR
jgi:probable HAF family extracellular repeat protein